MSTQASPMMLELWRLIEKHEPRAKLGGIVGDQAHAMESHTYHMSYNDQRHDGGYSVHFDADTKIAHRDKGYAAAIDVTLPPELMTKYTRRLHVWAKARAEGKPRTNLGGVVMEFAGTLDGRNVFSMDTHARPFVTTGFDPSHLWHNHLSIARSRVNDPAVLLIAQIYAPVSEQADIRARVAHVRAHGL